MPPPPPDFPEQCSANYTGSDGFCYNQHPDEVVTVATLGDCCHAAATHWGPRKCANGNCKGGPARNYNYFAANRSCELFGGAWHGDKAEGCSSGEHIYKPPPGPPPPAPCECLRMNEVRRLSSLCVSLAVEQEFLIKTCNESFLCSFYRLSGARIGPPSTGAAVSTQRIALCGILGLDWSFTAIFHRNLPLDCLSIIA